MRRSRPQLISEEIACECMLLPDVDGALAVNRATALFLDQVEDRLDGSIELHAAILRHVLMRMRRLEHKEEGQPFGRPS